MLAFAGIDDRASISNSGWPNLAPSTQRTFETFRKTGPDTNGPSLLYDEGGDSNGFCVEGYAWATTNGWRTVYAGAPVSPNTI